MGEEPSRLGRGLGALIAPRPLRVDAGPPRDDERPESPYREVPVTDLRPNPRQPRSVFDDDALAELAASISIVGLLQPIVVRPVGNEGGAAFEVVMGERRWRAAMAAGLTVVPVLVRETADNDMLRDAVLENLHRADLNPLDEAAAYAQLLADFGATHEQLAGRVGRSRAHVTNMLRLLHLPPPVQRRVAAGVLSAGHARALLGLADAAAQERLAGRIVAEGLSVRAVEEIVAVGAEEEPRRRTRQALARAPSPHFAELSEVLTERWDTRVRVEAGRNKGRLVVEFGSAADLDRILAMLAPDVLTHDDRPSEESAAAAG
jgi:ParB family transcriptional regulator, chromosome partitioning protein